MAVDDQGIEVLKKAGEEVTPGNKSDYFIKVGFDSSPISPSNPLPVSTVSSALPLGAATEAKQDDEIVLLTSIDSHIIKADTDNITVVSSVLPTGAATESTQLLVLAAVDQLESYVDGLESLITATNNLLTAIDGHVDQLEGYTDGIEGLITATNSLLTTIDGHIDQLEGYLDGVEGLLLTISGTLTSIDTDIDVALSTRASEVTLSALNAKFNSLGQKLMAASTPVVFASDQTALPLSAGAATSANQSTLLTRVGDVTETAPASDTASSGLNGRLQRIAQRLTTLIGTVATETTLAKLTQTQGSTTSGQSGPLIQGAVTTSEPTYTTAQTSPLSLTTAGRLRTEVVGSVASASTDSGNPVKTGGIINLDGSLFTNGQRANTQMNAAASHYVDSSGRILSYSATSSFTIAATATDIFTLTGSSTKTIKIRTLTISGTNTGNTNVLITVLKRSTANSGGTSNNLTEVPHDSNNAAATATALSYTVNPTTGTLVGNILTRLVFLPTLASSNIEQGIEEYYGQDGSQPITLRGIGEVFAVNLNGTAITGTTVMDIRITWTEE